MTYVTKTVRKDKLEQKFIVALKNAFLVDMIESESNPANMKDASYRAGRQNALYQALEIAELNQDFITREAWNTAKSEFDKWKKITQAEDLPYQRSVPFQPRMKD